MRTRLFSVALCMPILGIAAVCLSGCRNGETMTKSEQDRFQNPPKEMPKEAAEFMRNHGAAQPPAAATNGK